MPLRAAAAPAKVEGVVFDPFSEVILVRPSHDWLLLHLVAVYNENPITICCIGISATSASSGYVLAVRLPWCRVCPNTLKGKLNLNFGCLLSARFGFNGAEVSHGIHL